MNEQPETHDDERRDSVSRSPSTGARPIRLSEVAIVVEWENPRDVEARWPRRAMAALAAALREARSKSPSDAGRPRLLYVYDENVIDPNSIRRAIDGFAPDLHSLSTLELVGTDGLDYYALKNHGAERVDAEIVVFLDSDTIPEPHWLERLLAPFSRPEIMSVSGATSLVAEDLVSRTMALAWIFDLPSEHGTPRTKATLHANNCAMRRAYFVAHPFRKSAAFKKQCGLWLEALLERGHGFARAGEAHCLHAPQAGLHFVLWRAMQSGFDRDAKAAMRGEGRASRLFYAGRILVKKIARSFRRIVTLRAEVDLPAYQVPFAFVVAVAYYVTLAAGQTFSVCMNGIPDVFRARWVESF